MDFFYSATVVSKYLTYAEHIPRVVILHCICEPYGLLIYAEIYPLIYHNWIWRVKVDLFQRKSVYLGIPV